MATPFGWAQLNGQLDEGPFGRTPAAAIRSDEVEASFARIDALAKLLDSAFQVPGTKIAMWFDALLGLIPVIGDAISGLIASYIIFEARRLGAPTLAHCAHVSEYRRRYAAGKHPDRRRRV